jgi:hypothetical protein
MNKARSTIECGTGTFFITAAGEISVITVDIVAEDVGSILFVNVINRAIEDRAFTFVFAAGHLILFNGIAKFIETTPEAFAQDLLSIVLWQPAFLAVVSKAPFPLVAAEVMLAWRTRRARAIQLRCIWSMNVSLIASKGRALAFWIAALLKASGFIASLI